MTLDFTEVECSHFYTEVWPRLHSRAESLKSNWTEIRAAALNGQSPPDLFIHWGYKDDDGRKVVLALTYANPSTERHWVVSEILM